MSTSIIPIQRASGDHPGVAGAAGSSAVPVTPPFEWRAWDWPLGSRAWWARMYRRYEFPVASALLWCGTPLITGLIIIRILQLCGGE